MLSLSAGGMCDAVEDITGVMTEGNALKHVNAGYAKFLSGIDPRTNERHVWSFLQPSATLALAYQVTGTATGVYSAGTGKTTVTATTSIFAPTHIGDAMSVVTLTGTFEIEDYTSSTVVTIDGNNAFAGQVVTLPHSGTYDLPTDFGGMVDRPYFAYASDKSRCELVEASPEDLFRAYREGTEVNTARLFAVAPSAFVAATGQRWQIMFYPRFDEARFVRFRYLVLPASLTDSPTVYALGGAVHAYTIRALARADYEVMRSQPGTYTAEANALMLASIDQDAVLTETIGQTSLGHGGPEADSWL